MRNGAGRGRVTPQAVCVELHAFAHSALLQSICKVTGSILAAQETSGVFNVMTHSRHIVPKGALCVLPAPVPPSNSRLCIWPWVYKLDWFLFEYMVDLNFQVLFLE